MDISLNELIQFYLNNTLNLRPLTPQIIPCHQGPTHKMATVSWTQIMWRYFTLYVYDLHLSLCWEIHATLLTAVEHEQKGCERCAQHLQRNTNVKNNEPFNSNVIVTVQIGLFTRECLSRLIRRLESFLRQLSTWHCSHLLLEAVLRRRCCWAPCSRAVIHRYLQPVGSSAANPHSSEVRHAGEWRDSQTDRQTQFRRPFSAY